MGLIVYAARVLGTEGWGVFSYATSIGIILVIFSDIGSLELSREKRTKKGSYKTFIGTAVLLKEYWSSEHHTAPYRRAACFAYSTNCRYFYFYRPPFLSSTI